MTRLFVTNKSVYWPGEFSDVVNQLKGLNAAGESAYPGLFRFNTGAMVLAAAAGLHERRARDVGGSRQEISLETFEGHKLDGYVLLIPLLARRDVEYLRPERESELLREFERLAAGGFEVLRGLLASSSDPSGHLAVLGMLQPVLGLARVDNEEQPDILAE